MRIDRIFYTSWQKLMVKSTFDSCQLSSLGAQSEKIEEKKTKDMGDNGSRYFLERFEKEEGYEKIDDLDGWRSDELIKAIYR